MKTFSLTKEEARKLELSISMVQLQDRIVSNLQKEYEMYLMTVFGRCGLKPEDFERTTIDLQAGVLKIKEDSDDAPDIPKVQQQPKGALPVRPQARLGKRGHAVQSTPNESTGKGDKQSRGSGSV